MKVTDYTRKFIIGKLDSARVLVWYDGERVFGDFVQSFSAPNCRVVSARESRLRARREAETIYRRLNASDSLVEARANLLIYLPFQRAKGDERQLDPFEVFAVAGDAFGDDESEQLRSLAHQALPDLVDQIDRLFREGKPTLSMLDQLEYAPSYPLVREVFGTQSSVEVAVQWLGNPETYVQISAVPGCRQDILRLLNDELGFSIPSGIEGWEPQRGLLARYVLFSEFAFALPGELPVSLMNLPRADGAYQDRIYAIAHRLRETSSCRDAYIDLANHVEQELGLAARFPDVLGLGERDTFAFQEQRHLAALARTVENEQWDAARQIVSARAQSVWRYEPERAQVWKAAERCIELLDTANQVEQVWNTESTSLIEMIVAYTRPSGWSDLDRRQRLMEQSVAECTECEALEGVITRCRARYREVIDAIQRHFLGMVARDGWPPEGILRQTQVFDRFVAPALAAREKVAYFLSDSLRFEMGRDLVGAMGSLGEIDAQPIASALPTVTQVGMAALMPGADGVLSLRQVGDQLIPHVGERRLQHSGDRMHYLAERFGDRVTDIELSEFLSLTSTTKKRASLKDADLVVIRDSRIDRMGESITLREAHKYITDLLGDIKAAATQLIRLGYSYIVIATDHGHVLLPEVLPGDVVSESPAGDWILTKRRSLLGSQIQEKSGTCILSAARLGIQGDAPTLAVPNGFGLYSAGSGYFHGGLSLQECVLPVITLRARESPAEKLGIEVDIRYRRDTFTSRVIGVKVWFNSLVDPSIQAKIEAFDSSSPSAHKVGEAADCEPRDEVTHEVTLLAGQETPVPVLLDPDFDGDQVEIRVVNPEAPVVWARLTLKNETMD